MKKLLRPYLAFLLMGALLTTTACGDDDGPGPDEEGEVITTVMLSLVPEGKGQNATATISTLSGSPVQNGPLTLKANTVYNATITLADDSKTPSVNVTNEIKQKTNEHLFVYTFTPESGSNASVGVEIKDRDANNRPVGLETTINTGPNTGAGKLRVILKHQPGGIKTGTNTTAGETDVDVSFNVIVN
ncbi:hypothetical protein H9Q13_08875 [Pontibacter sp. JH31]|uniref:Type 1 periplasmic binding fold superfamily protein n=1 Tax=Pontibacter aquaedesilientis TaxID=2766980 RepID=A0ABR7XG56_9BACT|nr:hypothetical protein [Pontibacter aquaedesilientis]MBD1397275.1 hypothetical protein [Pontibacter aquaedesilientis]